MAQLKLFIPVFIGGGLGAMIRYSFSLLVVNYFKSVLPVATLIANLVAILIMGIALYSAESKMEAYPWLRAFILIGFCGGLSTFSTFSFETAMLLKGGEIFYAFGNVLVSVIAGTALIYPFISILEK